MNQQYKEKTRQNKREGDVFIKSNNKRKKHFKKDEGEYVDYEEVDDDK